MHYLKKILVIAIGLSVIKQSKGFKSGQKLARPFTVLSGPFGTIQCAKECLQRGRCNMMGYNQNHLRCELSEREDIVANDDARSITAPRSMITKYQGLLGQCANHSCPNEQKCLDTRFTPTCVKDISGCSTGWKFYNNHHYCFIHVAMTWNNVKKVCKSMQSSPVKVDDRAENTWIIKNAINKPIWLGATDEEHESKWFWEIDSSLMNFKNWGGGQPDNHNGKQHCATIRPNGEWDDVNCNSKNTFICET